MKHYGTDEIGALLDFAKAYEANQQALREWEDAHDLSGEGAVTALGTTLAQVRAAFRRERFARTEVTCAGITLAWLGTPTGSPVRITG
jgi:hypothetical protein